MTLEELSEQYNVAAEPLRKRLSELRHRMAGTDDPEEIWHLKRRIAELTPMLTQMNELTWLLAHYYEIGGADRDDRYGFNGKRKHKAIKRKTDGDPAPDIAERINRFAARDLLVIPLREEENGADRTGAGREQEHHLSDAPACRNEGSALHEVLPDVSAFFDPNPKRNRRRKNGKGTIHGPGV